MNLVAATEKRRVIKIQLLGELQGRHPLRNSPKHHQGSPTVVVRSGPNGAGKEVVDRSAFPTTILHDRGARAVMRSLTVGEPMAIRAAKPLRVKGIEEIPVAFLLIEKICRWEIASWRLPEALRENVDGQ